MDREFYELKTKLLVWDNENKDTEEHNWRETAMSICNKDIMQYDKFIKLPYRKAIEFLLIKNKCIQRENKQYE